MSIDNGNDSIRLGSHAAFDRHLNQVNDAFGVSEYIAPLLRGSNRDILAAKRPHVSWLRWRFGMHCKAELYLEAATQTKPDRLGRSTSRRQTGKCLQETDCSQSQELRSAHPERQANIGGHR